jgi:hypothetical protein
MSDLLAWEDLPYIKGASAGASDIGVYLEHAGGDTLKLYRAGNIISTIYA